MYSRGLDLLRCQTASLCDVMPALRKDVGCLPMVRPVSAINESKIRRGCVQLFRCAGLLVVFTEDGDLCSLNKESLSGTCEIGVQGDSSAGYKFAEYVLGRNAVCNCGGIHKGIVEAL